MKQKSKSAAKQVKRVLVALIACLGLYCLYYGSSFAPSSRRSDDGDGSDPVIGGFVGRGDFDDLHEDQDLNPDVPKSIPVRLILYNTALVLGENFNRR